MLRRGIPYGPPKDRTRLFEDDGVDRGLLFMSYQGSITDQFHFVTQTWANAPNSPHDSEPNTGHDSVIGQNAAGCFIRVPIDSVVANDVQLSLPTDPWVLMTGGGYFFTPSISALAGALSESVEELTLNAVAATAPSVATQPLQPFEVPQLKVPRRNKTKRSQKVAKATKGKHRKGEKEPPARIRKTKNSGMGKK